MTIRTNDPRSIDKYGRKHIRGNAYWSDRRPFETAEGNRRRYLYLPHRNVLLENNLSRV
jgi:hypothetical protein